MGRRRLENVSAVDGKNGRAGINIMTVLVLAEVFPPAQGGSGRWLWELYRRLSDVNVHVVAGHAAEATAFDKTARLPIVRIPLSFRSWGLCNPRGVFEYLRALARLVPLVTRTRPESIHCGKCLPEGLLAAAIEVFTGIPFYCFAHGEELTLAAGSRELTGLTRFVLHRASMIVANSAHTKQMLQNRWSVPKDRITVLYPGVDTTQFVPRPLDPSIRERLGWTGRRVILTVGALQKRKGQDMMIRALPNIRRRFPDVLYAIVGEGWERDYLEQIAREHGVTDVVQFLGVPDDERLIECYQQCDLFALPNRQVGWDFEGFGIVLLEAQACGRPVLTGRSGGTCETLSPTRTGVLASCDTPDAVAEAVSALLDNPRRAAMGIEARNWAVKNFDWIVLTEQARSAFSLGSAQRVGGTVASTHDASVNLHVAASGSDYRNV
jgi:phosphatidylinositol alpha-1,6-mannosyltransferase